MSTQTTPQVRTYTIDSAHSTVRFTIKHLMISKIHGELSNLTGNLTYDVQSPQNSYVEATIDAKSFTTGTAARDEHVKGPDFLDVENFPTIDFKSTGFKKLGDREFEVVGELTIHGVTRPVTLKAEASDEVASPFGGFKVGVEATATINRDDFGVTYNQALETGGVLIGKELHVQIDMELDRPAE